MSRESPSTHPVPQGRRGQKPGGSIPDSQGKSPRLALPRHSIRITAGELAADVELIVGRRVVAETTLERDVTRQSPAVRRFAAGYFHAPGH